MRPPRGRKDHRSGRENRPAAIYRYVTFTGDVLRPVAVGYGRQKCHCSDTSRRLPEIIANHGEPPIESFRVVLPPFLERLVGLFQAARAVDLAFGDAARSFVEMVPSPLDPPL
jgi:hypothetical protein